MHLSAHSLEDTWTSTGLSLEVASHCGSVGSRMHMIPMMILMTTSENFMSAAMRVSREHGN
eukprot:1343982-Amphidinium_carterae.1